MYQIAVCDDEKVLAEHNRAMAREILNGEQLKEEMDYHIDLYTKPEDLLERLREDPNRYHLFLLDIQIQNSNGLDLAKRIRENQTDSGLIYITSYRDYVFDSFATRPLQYLLKPVSKEKLAEALLYDYRNHYRPARQFLQVADRKAPLPINEIYYLESYQHRVNIHLKNKVIWQNVSLTSLERQLPETHFFRCHHSYLVNFAHVSEIVRYEARLDSGKIVPISKQNYNQTMQRYIEYLKD